MFFLFLVINKSFGASILIPMDDSQKNHLKAYGISYWILENQTEIEWLLNYRGGSFLVSNHKTIEEECIIRGVSYEIVPDVKVNLIKQEIANPEVNMEVVKMEVPPKIAVYTPKGKQPWDDAVTLVLTYAEIPYDEVYDSTIVYGGLKKYDWLHLHHEDFTGQYGKFYAAFRSASWYQQQQKNAEETAVSMGFSKVSQLKLAVVDTSLQNGKQHKIFRIAQ